MTGDKPRDATIYDVAAAAGVSPSTVSRAFSRPGRVSAQTADRIRAVAEDLGYRSRDVARPTSPARTKVIGLAVSDITNPFNFRVIRGCQSAAAEAGFIIQLNDAQENEAMERAMLKRSLPFIDGLVIASSRLSDSELRTVARNKPTVILNRRVSGLPCIVPDMGRGMRRAVEHLTALGHTDICYLAGPEASWADSIRWRTIRESAIELSFTEHRLGPFPPTIQGGRAAATHVIAQGHRAVIAYNDVMAIGLIRGLQERGIRIPEDVSVIGFDNIFAAELVSPGLTTVAAPLSMLGESSVRYLISVLQGQRPSESLPSTVPVRLIVRESTARLNPASKILAMKKA